MPHIQQDLKIEDAKIFENLLASICYRMQISPHISTISIISIKYLFLQQGLLEKEPTMRASWAQILCHPFVEGRLYIKAGVKAENSPFVNPQNAKSKTAKTYTQCKDKYVILF